MNYAGHEKLRAEVAEVANTMCDLRARLNDMEHRCRFDSDVLVERLTRHVLLRRRLTLRFILPPRSEAGCPAGLVLLRSMIWKRFSGGGAGVFHHCHHLTGFSGRRNHSGG